MSIWVYLTAIAKKTFGAGTSEGIKSILTDAPIEAGLGITFIHLILAVGASEARAAGA